LVPAVKADTEAAKRKAPPKRGLRWVCHAKSGVRKGPHPAEAIGLRPGCTVYPAPDSRREKSQLRRPIPSWAGFAVAVGLLAGLRSYPPAAARLAPCGIGTFALGGF
jgi:hypothetical protein